jgi:hypothetical protein
MMAGHVGSGCDRPPRSADRRCLGLADCQQGVVRRAGGEPRFKLPWRSSVIERKDSDPVCDLRVFGEELVESGTGLVMAREVLDHITVFDVDKRIDHAERLPRGVKRRSEQPVRLSPDCVVTRGLTSARE